MKLDLAQLLTPDEFDLISRIGQAADAYGSHAYLIGGQVRDILLGVDTVDIDVMLEHDVIAFTEHLFERWPDYFGELPAPSKPVSFLRFATAKLLFDQMLCEGVDVLDFATARSETYPRSGGRPEIYEGSLDSDLARRDFSVNAMAISLSAESFGVLHDMFNGVGDLKRREINILHDKSFVDDPARLFRALRFINRFGFSMGEQTKELFNEAVEGEYLLRLSAYRRFDEFRKLLGEPNLGGLLEKLAEINLLRQVHPKMELSKEALEKINASEASSWENALALLLLSLDDQEYADALAGFKLNKSTREQLMQVRG